MSRNTRDYGRLGELEALRRADLKIFLGEHGRNGAGPQGAGVREARKMQADLLARPPDNFSTPDEQERYRRALLRVGELVSG